MNLNRVRERVSTGFHNLRAATTTTSETGWTNLSGAGITRMLPGSSYDYRREAGNLWDNSIVLACLKWMGRTFPEALPCIQQKDAKGQWEIVQGHPFPTLLEYANPLYGSSVLWQATLICLAIDGNSYWHKLRSGAGKLVGFQHISFFRIRPFIKSDGTLCYRYFNSRGAIEEFPAESIIHFRDGKHPENDLIGLSSLGAVLREVCTDNEAGTFMAAILRKMGIPGAVICPKGGPEVGLTDEQVKDFKRSWRENFTGENRGDVFVQGIPVDVQNPGFSPEQLVLDKVRDIPEERITSALGIPAVVVGLGTGLEQSNNRASSEEADSWAWRNCLIPTQRILAGQLTRDLREVEHLLGPTERFWFDLGDVGSLQQDEDKLHGRARENYQKGLMTRNEARSMIGLPPVEGEPDSGQSALPDGLDDEDEPDDDE